MSPYPTPKSLSLPLLLLTLLLLLLPYSHQFQLQLLSPQTFNKATKIFTQSELSPYYNDREYNRMLTCASGELTVIEFEKKEDKGKDVVRIGYGGIRVGGVRVEGKWEVPVPKLVQGLGYGQGLGEGEEGVMVFEAGCLGNETDITNYFNKIDITIDEYINSTSTVSHKFSFLLGCDKGGRNKKFQVGYIIITAINAAITIGVALHSRIWSIRYLNRPLSIQLKWHRFLIIMLILAILATVLYLYAADQFKNANNMLKYLGLVLAYIFTFICSDEIFFLVRRFKKEVYRHVRICDVISFFVASGMFVGGFFVDSWVYYDVLAVAICVGAIKLLRFSTMKQAYLSLAISVGFVSVISAVFHFVLTRSYNDYASELSSPLFIAIPDLITELYKKCSWLPVIDVILPGVFLSFLRTYDENYSTGWGGVYTVIGNVSFIVGTILWVLLQAVYPYSIPFSLVTYTSLCLSIFLMSYKRNEFKTLWTGRFNGANNEMRSSLIVDDSESNRQSFGNLITPELIDSIKYVESEEDGESVEGRKSVEREINKSDQ